MRAYCVALARRDHGDFSRHGWGLPVSSTHIAIGAVFGVGFFREWYHERISERKQAGYNIAPPSCAPAKKKSCGVGIS